MMKKLFALMLVVVVGVSAQSWTNLGSYGGGAVEIKGLVAWSPFTADSVGIQVSNPLDLSGVDSIHVWSSAISATSTAHLVGGLYCGFSSTFATTTHDSLAPVIDTTNAKLETMNFYSTIKPLGSQFAFVRLNPKSGGTGLGYFYGLRKDAVLNVYLVLYKRQVAFRPN